MSQPNILYQTTINEFRRMLLENDPKAGEVSELLNSNIIRQSDYLSIYKQILTLKTKITIAFLQGKDATNLEHKLDMALHDLKALENNTNDLKSNKTPIQQFDTQLAHLSKWQGASVPMDNDLEWLSAQLLTMKEDIEAQIQAYKRK